MFGIGEGPSSGELSNYGSLVSSSGVATGTGESDLSASNKFMQSILSGDPTQIAQTLSPEISSLKTSVGQDQKTRAMQGNRSGGSTAATAAEADKAHGDITNLIGTTRANAASTLGSEGSNLLSTGMSGNQAAFGEADTIHQQNLAKINDIIKSISSFAAAPFTGGKSLGLGDLSMPGNGGTATSLTSLINSGAVPQASLSLPTEPDLSLSL